MAELLQPIQQLHQLLGRPVVAEGGEVAIVEELVAMIALVLANLSSGAEAFKTKVYAGDTFDTDYSEERTENEVNQAEESQLICSLL